MSDKIPVTGFSDMPTLDFSLIAFHPKDIKFYLEEMNLFCKKQRNDEEMLFDVQISKPDWPSFCVSDVPPPPSLSTSLRQTIQYAPYSFVVIGHLLSTGVLVLETGFQTL